VSKVFAIILLAVAGVFVSAALILGLGYLSFSNQANGFETDIKAKYADNKNVYDNGWKKVKEVAQVPDLQVAALQKVYETAMTGRYGDDGSRAVVQFITEQNPNLDQQTFVKIQQDIEAFRNEFKANQTQLVSQKQAYERFLRATTSGRFYNMLGGYPRIDLDKFDIVTSERTEEDFKSKKSEPISLK
jgi:hypothetical protein